jgi:large subunit ribosomal protein L25
VSVTKCVKDQMAEFLFLENTMSQTFEVIASVRNDLGKGASRRLRREDKIPAVLYGGDKEALSLTLDQSKLVHALENEAFYSSIINLNIDGEIQEAVLRDLQRHPYKPKLIHADFHRVTRGQELTARVPLHFINEDVCVGVKAGGSIQHNITDVEIKCRPSLLPEFIEIDMAEVTLGQIIHLTDIKLPEGVNIIELMQGADHDQPVVSVQKKSGPAEDAGEDEAEDSAE